MPRDRCKNCESLIPVVGESIMGTGAANAAYNFFMAGSVGWGVCCGTTSLILGVAAFFGCSTFFKGVICSNEEEVRQPLLVGMPPPIPPLRQTDGNARVVVDFAQMREQRRAAEEAAIAKHELEERYIGQQEQAGSIPNEYLCPITREVMRDPVVLAESGQTYEKTAIIQWIASGNHTDPFTKRSLNRSLELSTITPNYALKSLINRWLEEGVRALVADEEAERASFTP